jgi:hypothetical protein
MKYMKYTCAPEGPFSHYIGLIGGGLPREIAPGSEPLASCEANDDVEYAPRQFPDTRIAETGVEVSISQQDLATLLYKQALISIYIIPAISENAFSTLHQATIF